MIRTYGTEPFKIAVVHGGPGACGSVACIAKELSKICGAIEPIQSKHSIPELIDEMHEQIIRITTGPITLLGHSWGAWLVILYTVRHPYMVNQVILVGSGPFEKEFVPCIMKRRLRNLTPCEAVSMQLLLTQLEDQSVKDKDSLLASLSVLIEKSDGYDLVANGIEENALDGEMYASIWPQAEEMRNTGQLALALGKLQCPVTVIHGDYDPHPLEGVTGPLREQGIGTDVHLLPKCGHSPFREKLGRDQFYTILTALIT